MWRKIMNKQKKITQKEITQKQYVGIGKNFDYYIRESDICLRTDECIVIHLDGIGFTHKYYNKFSEDIKHRIVKALADSSFKICNDITSIRIAYAFSDEVSFILDGQDIQSNMNNRINKLISLFTSKLTLYFNKELIELNEKELESFINNAFFSAKAFNLPSSKVEDYLKWRLLGCKKLIFDKKLNFDNCKPCEKYGYIITKKDSWHIETIDFANSKIKKEPQNIFFQIRNE